MVAVYLFLNFICILTTSATLAKYFTPYSVYSSNHSLWKIQDTAEINFDCFIIDESNQEKLFREIMRFQGYFFQIALEASLFSPSRFIYLHIKST